jgi:NAD(P)-dependent dehydrogenase (short-subunit alcohol dehydrogenase family)
VNTGDYLLKPEGRVVMISGANRGIGRAIAGRLAEEGYRLSLGVRDQAQIEKVNGEFEGKEVLVHQWEAKEPTTSVEWAEATVSRYGRIDAVVSNAGLINSFDLESDDESGLDEMWEVNTKGPLRLVRAAWPYLKQAGSGRVIGIVSLSGLRVRSASMGGYAMSKHAAEAFLHVVRYSGWESGIRTTAICPGYVATDMTAGVATPPKEEMVQPQAVAHLVAMVLSLPNPSSVVTLPVNCLLESSC